MSFRVHLAPILGLAFAALFAGCVAPRSDLSAPRDWRSLDAEPVVVARAGRTLPIVTDNNRDDRWAAMFLANAIEATCGSRPDVFVASAAQRNAFTNGLFLTRDASEGAEGFRVTAANGRVDFRGRADYAVFDWCERTLGMRYYCEGGQCFESRAEIVVPAAEYADRPVYAYREISGGETWTRIAKTGRAYRGGVAVHAPQRWFRDAQLVAEHPDIFETGKTPMLCYGNPATLAYYQRRIDRHIAGLEDSGGIVDTNRQVVTVCQWDAPVACRCRWCAGLYDRSLGRRGDASPIIWGTFLAPLDRWLAETHPDYEISFLPYLNTVAVPQAMPSLVRSEAEVCTMPGLALLKDDACREREEETLRAWRRVTGRKVLNWNYGCWPLEWTSAPYVFGRTVQRHCDAMRDTVVGTFVCGGDKDPRIALSMYVWAKCLWNPAVDVEAIYDGFARRMFGAGAEPMRALIALQERCWNRPWPSSVCDYHNIYEISFPPRDVAEMRRLLLEAEQLAVASGDASSVRRIRWYASGLTTFFAEAAAQRAGERLALGETRRMVSARSVARRTWAPTDVTTARRGERFEITVVCREPAAAKLDYSDIDHDFVWGDDCVTFVFEELGEFKVYRDGSRRGETANWSARVTHDDASWTVTASFALPAAAERAGAIRGNIARWRVGDRRFPQAQRVAGSCYEHSRLHTRYTDSDADAAAMVELALTDAAE